MEHVLSKSTAAHKGEEGQVVRCRTILAESGRMNDAEETSRTNVSPAQDKGCRDGEVNGSSAEEDRWMGFSHREKGQERNGKKRDEQQRQADERKLIMETMYKALTEGS